MLPIAALAAFALALGACGGDDGGGGTAEGDGEITIFSLWGGSEQEAFQKVLDQFTKDTGIKTKYESARDFLPVIRTRLAAGNPPKSRSSRAPASSHELARDDALIPLEDLGLDPDKINENYSDTWTDLATFEDTIYGVVAKANSKSIVWYKPNSFQQNGFEIPTTWDHLLEITKDYKDKGETPWAVGAQGRDNSWTLTDWFENIYARQPGRQVHAALLRRASVQRPVGQGRAHRDDQGRQRPVRRRRHRHRARHRLRRRHRACLQQEPGRRDVHGGRVRRRDRSRRGQSRPQGRHGHRLLPLPGDQTPSTAARSSAEATSRPRS